MKWRREYSLVKVEILNKFPEEKPSRRVSEKDVQRTKMLSWGTNTNGASNDIEVDISNDKTELIDSVFAFLVAPKVIWNLNQSNCELWKSRVIWVLRNAIPYKWFRYDKGKCKSLGLFQMNRPFGVCGNMFDQSSAMEVWKKRKRESRFGGPNLYKEERM